MSRGRTRRSLRDPPGLHQHPTVIRRARTVCRRPSTGSSVVGGGGGRDWNCGDRAAAAMSKSTITSTELNFLVFRYLQESGFTHSAFSLGYEAGVNKSEINGNLVPPGALITLVQKGLQYIEMEANLSDGEAEVEEDFSLLQPLELISKDTEELQAIIKKRKREKMEGEREKEKRKGKESVRELERHAGGEKERDKHERERDHVKERDKDRERERERERERDREEREKEKEKDKDKDKDKDKEKEKEKEKEKLHLDRPEKSRPTEDKSGGGKSKKKRRFFLGTDSEGAEPMDATLTPYEISNSEVTILEGHSSEVFACAWSPAGSLLASGSGDSTARIWTIPEVPCGVQMQAMPLHSHVLKHFKGRVNEKSKDVTTLDWNVEGTLLATGSYDGQARIWGRDGELKNTLVKHKGPIFSLKWNKKGDLLLSGSVDKTAIVWDTRTWECRQQFEFHSAPALDVDWRNNNTFATCSTDNMIYVCRVGENRPVKAFYGHQGEVNAIKWDPTGNLLASCSDDGTAKIWSLKQDKCLYDFREHIKEIYTIRWSPTGMGTNNPNQQLILASASFDSTIKLWDIDRGCLLHSLAGHKQPVYSVAFSPNGEYLASGSLDQCLHIWSVKDGKILRTYKGGGGIFEVCWNKEGDKLAACFSNNTVCVMDFRK